MPKKKAPPKNVKKPKNSNQSKRNQSKNANRHSYLPLVSIAVAIMICVAAFLVGLFYTKSGRSMMRGFSQLWAAEQQPNESSDLAYFSAECDTDAWLNRNGSLPGYHLLCVTGDRNNGNIEIEFYRNGVAIDGETISAGNYTSNANDYSSLRRELERVLKINPLLTDDSRQKTVAKDRHNAWHIFTPFGYQISNISEEAFIGTLLVFESGVFIYPPIEIGYRRNVTVMNPTPTKDEQRHLSFTLETLSCHPIILAIPDFLPPGYADAIVAESEPYMKVSGVTHMHNTKGDSNQWRTSTTHWLRNSLPFVQQLNSLTALVTRVPLINQENVQVLRYLSTQQYDSHWDYFAPSLYKGTDQEEKIRGNKNRLATLFWYMSDVADGGWTIFPMSGQLRTPKSFKLKRIEDCLGDGLRVAPVKNQAILFYSMLPSGELDANSLHGACPVGEESTKWAANKWIWNKPVEYTI